MSGGVSDMRPATGLDVARLEEWLAANVQDFRGPLSIKRFCEGQSNPTYLLETPTRRYVMRCKPPGVLLPSAHAVDREYQLLTALKDTDVPAPRPLALCTDNQITGTWFYVMTHMEGRIFWDPTLPTTPRSERKLYHESMVDALARLHCLDWRSVGLGNFGKPDHYLQRQIERWARQHSEDSAAGRVPAMERLTEWLRDNVPAEETASIVHGDYRCDNVMFHPTQPRVVGIVDWELATIGHPVADFAYYLMVYRLPSLAFPGLLGADLAALGVPAEEQQVQSYCRLTGRANIPDLNFYLAFSLFRLAGILHGIRGRVIRGTAVSPKAHEYARHVEAVADLGWQQASNAE